ncbi:MAG: hypothetical protein WC683_19885 [bacterium]
MTGHEVLDADTTGAGPAIPGCPCWTAAPWCPCWTAGIMVAVLVSLPARVDPRNPAKSP